MSSEGSRSEGAVTYPRGFSESINWRWPLIPARDLVLLNYGRALKADIRKSGNVPVYGTNGQCGWHDSPLASGPGVIIGRKGQGPLGVEWCQGDFWVIDTAYYLSALTPNIDLKYLYYLIKYIGLNHLKDGTSNPTLSRDVFGSQLFPVPSLFEQERIAGIMGLLDDRIDLLHETNITLEAIAQALFKSWFVDFDPVRAKAEGRPPEGMDAATAALFPDGFEESELGSIPKGWAVNAFTACVDVVGGGTPKTSIAEYWGGEIPWFSVVDAPSPSDVFVIDTEKHITEAGLRGSSAKILKKGTTIISARGTVGRLALVGREMAMNQSCYGLVGKAGDAYFTYFSTCGLVSVLQQRSHGSVFDTITRDTLSGVNVVYPSVSTISAFEGLLFPIMERIKGNIALSDTLSRIRDELLPRLISGQLRLPESEEKIQEVMA